MCASIKRLFIAFLISNFMAPVKVWLGVEYLKLAGRLGVAGIQQQDQNLSRSGKLFKALVVLCFCSAAMYIINMVVVYAWLYPPLMALVDNPSDPGLPAKFFSLFGGLLGLVIGSIAITIVESRIAMAAWQGILSNLAGEPSPAARESGSFQVARVIKGAKNSFLGGVLVVITVTLFIVMFGVMMPGMLTWTPSTAMAMMVILIILLIAALILSIAGLVLSISGTINQAIGLFDLGKRMELDPSIEGMILGSDGSDDGSDDGSGDGGGKSRQGGLCLKCLHRLPDDPSVKFCPICGNPI